MKKTANFLVDKRHIILTIFLIFAGISAFLMGKVSLNYDMTKYLPDDSSMKKGMDIMEQEFGEEHSSSLRVMFSNLSETEKTEIYNYLSSLKNTTGVDWEAGNTDHNKDGYTLYVIHTELDAYSDECTDIFDEVSETYSDKEVYFSGDIDSANEPVLPTYILIVALLILVVVLFIMSESWFEPVVFFANIAVAVLINMGTNIFLPSVSNLTYSVVPILQLVLSMDYSIILMNRYTQEKAHCSSNTDAMKNALANAFSSVTSSSLTTFVGLLALIFMSFKIGADMGVALAKSVLISLICIFTVLPSLILISDKWITKLHKKSLNISMNRYAKFTARFRYIVGIAFLCIFAVAAMLKGSTEITYSLETSNKVDEIFPSDNTVVMLYDRTDEDAAEKIAAAVEEGVSQLEGENYGRIIINTSYAEDSAETRAFMEKLNSLITERMDGNCYLIGNSPMSYEMSQTFDSELNKITLITAAAIFVVVALTFRSLLIPLLLVMIVQCGVFATMTFIGISGGSMYYLALLIVQCILMGATIDYGILFTNYYCSARETMDVQSALKDAYNGAMHTILTSSLIVVAVTGILGLTLSDPTVASICLTIAEGALCATLLILFLLPGALACMDRFICKKKK